MTADKIIRDFEKINDKVVKLVPEMVQVTGTKIQMDAKRDVPRDTSRLHNSKTNYAEDGQMTAVVRSVAEGSAPVEYGVYVEFGTYKMAAQPFMMPAFERHSQRFIDALNKLIRDL